MTQEEKARAYDEALKIAKRIISKNCSEVEKLCLKSIFPELAESEDEKIGKWLYNFIHNCPNETFEFYGGVGKQAVLAYLEKQKEQEHICDSAQYEEGFKTGYELGLRKQKEQKPTEKQDYSGLNDLERAIHRGFLCAGVENVPVTTINETAKECLKQMKPAEWSEEDEKKRQRIIKVIEAADSDWVLQKAYGPYGDLINWLKSLRPSWKPSEDQMNALYNVINPCDHVDKKALESLYKQLEKLI